MAGQPTLFPGKQQNKMTNEDIRALVDEEKVQQPYNLYKRFYYNFVFPGFGHFSLGLKPKNIIYPVIGLVLVVLMVFMGISAGRSGSLNDSLTRLSTYKTERIGSEKWRAVLSSDSQLARLNKVFIAENVPGEVTQALLVCGTGVKKLEENKKSLSDSIFQEYNDKIAEAASEAKAAAEQEGAGADDREPRLIEERDTKIEKEIRGLVIAYENELKSGAASPVYSFIRTSAFDDITSKYALSAAKNKYKFIFMILFFVGFWVLTFSDLVKFFNFGKLYGMLGGIKTGLGFLSLNIAGFMLFVFGPVLYSFFLSFNQWDILTERVWVGFDNFSRLFGDPLFWKYLGNTFFFFINIPIGMAAAITLAVALNQKIKGITIYRVVYYLPVVSSMVAIALLWKWIYNPDFGLLNTFLKQLGVVDPPKWLTSIVWAKPAISIMDIWKGVGGGMLLYLAALQGIPSHLYEAADIDGASSWKQFVYITLPLLGPTHFFNIIMGVIGNFQAFGSQYVMTQGGPAGATTTIVYYIYNNAFQWFKMGYASAIAWVLFAMVFVATIINWRYTGSKLYTD